jgi:hypothetical protein
MVDAIASSGPSTDGDAVKAIFMIQTESSSGTGFLFHDNRHILTAYHVVEGTKQNKVKVRDLGDANAPKDYSASIQNAWKDCDIALLYLDEPIPGVQHFTLSPSQTLRHNMKIRTYGFPRIFGKGFHRAEIAGGPLNGKYEIDFEVGYLDGLKGLSGSPVFLSEDNLSGNNMYFVIGIMSNQSPGNLQKGSMVPTEAFYDEITNILARQKELDIWCYIVRSEADVEKEQKKSPYTLKVAVESALKNDPQVKDGTKRLEFEVATELVSKTDNYRNAVKKICKARIAIFDITRFEPAVMLLLGVRSVVRRGVTIASTGEYIIGDAFDIPFNIKELTIISHSAKQYKEAKRPPSIIRDKIKQGLKQLKQLPQYLDLPAFDAVRNLPPDYRTPDPDNVLVLCPYSKKYQDINWKQLESLLSPWLSKEEASDMPEGESDKEEPRIMRILDLMSPRLVSSTIYEAIRCKDLCLVDWTEWRPNVFFEFGVRLAVSGSKAFTVCIIEDRHKDLIQEINKPISDDHICWLARVDSKDLKELEVLKERYTHISAQCKHLLTLFDPLEYNAPLFAQDSTDDPVAQDPTEIPLEGRYQFEGAVYDNMMHYYKCKKQDSVDSNEKFGRAPNLTYEVIEDYIDFKEEPVSVPVYIDLLRTAELFGVESNKSQTVVLYPKNKDLNSSVQFGITQRLLAAWYYIRKEHNEEEKIIKDETLFDTYRRIGVELISRIQESRPELAKEIDDVLEDLLQKKENAHEQ